MVGACTVLTRGANTDTRLPRSALASASLLEAPSAPECEGAPVPCANHPIQSTQCMESYLWCSMVLCSSGGQTQTARRSSLQQAILHTHLVVGDLDANRRTARSLKYCLAMARGMWIVSPEWLVGKRPTHRAEPMLRVLSSQLWDVN